MVLPDETSEPVTPLDSEPSTSSNNPSTSSTSSRQLRKRKINLNALASSLSSPQVCQWAYCGIQLKDGDSLEWHYQGHLAQELEKLSKGVRVKRNPKDFPDRSVRSRVRKSTYDKIKFRRETRKAIPITNRQNLNTSLRCQVCDQVVQSDDESSDIQTKLQEHLEACLRVAPDPDMAESDSEVDVDGAEGFEEYEWAGQRRIRATSLIEGGLRGAGFLTITRGDEDEELDVENDVVSFGVSQYDEKDIILTSADSKEEEEERSRLRQAIIGDVDMDEETTDREVRQSDDVSDQSEELNKDPKETDKPNCDKHKDLGTQLEELKRENEELKRSGHTCNVCMDSYNVPVVSVVCWHVHCEECWLRALGAKMLCPQCKVIVRPKDLRKIYL